MFTYNLINDVSSVGVSPGPHIFFSQNRGGGGGPPLSGRFWLSLSSVTGNALSVRFALSLSLLPVTATGSANRKGIVVDIPLICNTLSQIGLQSFMNKPRNKCLLGYRESNSQDFKKAKVLFHLNRTIGSFCFNYNKFLKNIREEWVSQEWVKRRYRADVR